MKCDLRDREIFSARKWRDRHLHVVARYANRMHTEMAEISKRSFHVQTRRYQKDMVILFTSHELGRQFCLSVSVPAAPLYFDMLGAHPQPPQSVRIHARAALASSRVVPSHDHAGWRTASTRGVVEPR